MNIGSRIISKNNSIYPNGVVSETRPKKVIIMGDDGLVYEISADDVPINFVGVDSAGNFVNLDILDESW